MTVYEQAHGLIDMLSEESAEVVVQVLLRMLPYDKRPARTQDRAAGVRQTAKNVREAVSYAQPGDSSSAPDPLLLSLLAGKKAGSVQDSDPCSDEVDAFNEEMSGIFGTDPLDIG